MNHQEILEMKTLKVLETKEVQELIEKDVNLKTNQKKSRLTVTSSFLLMDALNIHVLIFHQLNVYKLE